MQKEKCTNEENVQTSFKIGKIEFSSILRKRHSVIIAYSLLILKILPWFVALASILSGKAIKVAVLIIELIKR